MVRRIPSLPQPERLPPVMKAQRLSSGRWQARVCFRLADGSNVEQQVGTFDSREECYRLDPRSFRFRLIERGMRPRLSRTPGGRWRCRVTLPGVGRVHVGTFDTDADAMEAGWETLASELYR